MKYGIFPGRFQPYHNGHLWVINHFFDVEKKSKLVIGIVNPDPVKPFEGENNIYRLEKWNNPFNYWQRYKMIKDSLKPDYCSKVSIVPMPRPEVDYEKVSRYLPLDEESFFFIPTLEEFDMWKIEQYQRKKLKRGLKIIRQNEIPEELRMIRGRYIRALYLCRGNWEYFVPDSTIQVLKNDDVYNYVSTIMNYSNAINQIENWIASNPEVKKVIGHSIGDAISIRESENVLNRGEVPIKELINHLKANLRDCVHETPNKEKEISNIVEILLKVKGYKYNREKRSIPFSTKKYIPDFTFEDINTVLEIKLCTSKSKEGSIIDEINSDIPAYTSEFENIIFLVYDVGTIRVVSRFQKEIKSNNPNIHVIVIKH